MMKADIKVGTELSIGVVVSINSKDVTLVLNGSRYNASFTAVEKAYADGFSS